MVDMFLSYLRMKQNGRKRTVWVSYIIRELRTSNFDYACAGAEVAGGQGGQLPTQVLAE